MSAISELQGIGVRTGTTLDRVGSPGDPASRPAVTPLPPGAGSFADALAEAGQRQGLPGQRLPGQDLAVGGLPPAISLSSHAQRRLEQRDISLGTHEAQRLGRAMDLLAAKGGRQSLVMLDDVAFVVHVPSHTVVTAVGPNDRKEAVFTQIDSVAIA